MENVKSGMFFIALDGDGIGKLVGRAVIANDVDELHKVSNRIDAAQDYILHWCTDNGGEKISGGGDEATMSVPKKALSKIEALRKSIEKSFGYTISVGVGKSLSEAGTSLLVAKLRGKDQVVYFNKKIKEDIKKAKRRVHEGRASQEEYKLSEAYLEKSENMAKCDLHKAKIDDNKDASDKMTARNNRKAGIPENWTLPTRAGGYIEEGDTNRAKLHHEQSLARMKDSNKHSNKSNLGKTEHTCDLHKATTDKRGRRSSVTGHEKGVHMPLIPGSDTKENVGLSNMGYKVRHPNPSTDKPGDSRSPKASSKRILGQMKNIKPNLEKSTTGRHGGKAPISGHEKGVHTPLAIDAGKSVMGSHIRHPSDSGHGSKEMARRHAQNTLNEIKSIKPKLDKSEEDFQDQSDNTEEHDDCPYCAENKEGNTDDCPYCQELDAKENADGSEGMDDCPACQEYDQEQGSDEHEDCPYCQELDGKEQAPDESDLAVSDMDGQHPDECPQCQEMYSDAVENEPDQTGQEDPSLQGHETAEEVLALLDQEPGSGDETPMEEASQIDNTELPQGDQMKGNTSVEEDFGPAQQEDVTDEEQDFGQSGQESGQDMSQSDESGQDSPDMTDVLQGGLDDHAQEQRKQEVLNMVSQTLQGFKANKESLEATKDQNQALYQSCIQMLKSMIELCKLLGLEPKMPAQPQSEQGLPEAQPEQQDQPMQAQQAAAPMEGAAQDPKTMG